MTQALQTAVQRPAPGPYVVLFDLDTSPVGGGVYHFTQSAYATAPVRWRGIEYAPYDVEAEGFEWSGTGALPTPKLRVSNVNRAFSALVGTFNDLIGSTVIRWRTFAQFLDGQPGADPDAHFPVDIYRIERKSVSNKTHIEWELAAAMDQEGRMLPGRMVLRDTCTLRYRVPNGVTFDYGRATCPYAGGSYFNENGQPAGMQQDACGKKLSDCKLRFGTETPLPFNGFPGVAKTRI